MFSKLFNKNKIDDVDEFIEECIDNLETVNDSISENYGIGNYERWDFDQETAEIIFSENGDKKIVAKVSFIGSYSANSESWMWGWSNVSLLPHLTKEINKVREFGEKNKIEMLTDQSWSATEEAGWAMAAIALHVIGGEGVYRGVSNKNENFFLLHTITVAGNS